MSLAAPPRERVRRTEPPAADADPRLGPVSWPIPSPRTVRRRSVAMAALCIPLAVWYLSWLLQGRRVGEPVLFGLLIAAEAFNLTQALGFWWTCAHQRVRGGRAPTVQDQDVDVLIPVYNEPLSVVAPTVAAARALRGAAVHVWLLDDGRRDELARLADREGVAYLRREERSGAKAGNLNHALALTRAPHVAVLDCDHVPHGDFLERTLGHLEDPDVAFVQTPQYYANASVSAVCSAAAAQQNLFFGPISRGKDGLDSMMCCGTNVVFNRTALDSVGGFPENSLTEDFLLSIRLQERGWRSVYVSEVVASGLGPEDMTSYVSQQQRWARGCLGSIPAVLVSRLPWRAKLQYLLSATYFLSGWTLVVYMSLPVIRLVLGLQPLARISADQFLIHFAPYYVGALSAVALAGSGTYTFSAFALSACNFWIHIGASLRALLRRGARFVVTPKHGSRARQPRAIAPALGAVAVLVAAAAYGLARGRSPATLNNVAFAGLHSTILLIGAMPALRIGRSGVLHPEPRVIATPAHRRWPRAVSAIVAASAIGAAAGLSLTGLRALSIPASLNQQAYSAARSFMRTYVSPAGRVVRRDQGGGTVSEGQAYGLLLAVALDDRSELQRIWSWTRSHLLLSDHLLASAWSGGRVTSNRPATDADLDSAWALVLASERFGVASYRSQGVALAHAILAEETAASPFGPVLVAGPWGRAQPAIVNPSYFSPRAFADLSRAAPDPRWAELESSSRAILSSLIGRHGAPAARAGQPTAGAGRSAAASLAPDWAATDAAGQQAAWPISNPGSPAAGGGSSSFDALRIAIRFASSCDAADRRLAASLWPLYARDPGRDSYTLGGAPISAFHHAASFVAAAAAARAAGKKAQADRLLGDAAAANEAQPTYYGAAWLALGRVMLTSAALGGCA